MKPPAADYDLSHPVFENCAGYPDVTPRPAHGANVLHAAGSGVNKEIMEVSTHTGTHCDAPFHFFEDGRTIDQIPLENYGAPAAMADLRHKTRGQPSRLWTVKDLQLVGGEVVLLNTGWGLTRLVSVVENRLTTLS